MDGTNEPVARSTDDGTDVRRVEDVGLLTTNPTSDVEMADNETAEDALETVRAIIEDITAAAVSPTASSQSTTIITDVDRVADVKACVGGVPLDVASSDEPATIACVPADVKAATTDVAIEMDTDARADVTAVVGPDTDVNKMDTGITDVGEIDSDVVHMDTDLHTNGALPVKTDTAVASSTKNITTPVAADSNIKPLVITDKAITPPVTIDKDITPTVTIDKDITGPVTIDKAITPPVTIDKDITPTVTIDKNIAGPVTIDEDITAPVTIDKDITPTVTIDKDIAGPVTIDEDITPTVTIDKNIAGPVTIDEDITAPVTTVKDIPAPVTTDKDITPPVTLDKDIAPPVTLDKDITPPVTTDKDITSPVMTDKAITSPVTADNSAPPTSDRDITAPLVANTETAAMEVPTPLNSKNDLPPNETLKPPETLSSTNISEPLLLENITEKTDGNDTSMEDFSNLSLPSFSESKSSVDQKFAGNVSECSFQKQRSLSEKSNIEDSSKGLPAIRGERDVSSLGDKLVNMQRPFRNIGESSGIIDAGKYLDDGMPSFSGSRDVPLELPNSSSSKDLTLMMSAKDAMIMPDDSQHDSCNVDNIEIIQLIEDTTSASVSMDVNRLLASKVEPIKDVSAVLVVADEQSAEDSVPVSVAEDSLLSKDSIDTSDLKVVEVQAVAPTESSAEVVPEDSCKSEASGKEANGGDVDMVEESQPDASGGGDKQGTDVDGSERDDDGERKDKKLSKSAKKRRPGICAETEEEDSEE